MSIKRKPKTWSARKPQTPFYGLSMLAIIVLTVSRVFINALDLIGVIVLGAVVGSLTGSSAQFPPIVTELLPNVSGAAKLVDFTGAIVIGFGFFLLKSALTLILGYVSSRYFANVEGRWASELFSRYLMLDQGAFRSTSREQLMHGLTYGLRAMVSERLSASIAIAGELSLLLVISAYLAFTNFTLFLTAAFYFSVVGLVMAKVLSKAADKSITEMNQQMLRTQALILDAASLFREVRPGSRGKSLRDAFVRARRSAAFSSGRYSVAITIPRHITEVSLVLGVGLLLAIYSGVSAGNPSTAVIGVFALGVFRITAAMLPLQSNITTLRRTKEESKSTRDLLANILSASSKTESLNRLSSVHEEEKPSIEFRNFKLPQGLRQETKALNLVIPFGSVVFVHGPSGAGKSTLSDILLGLQDPGQGDVLIGGKTPGEFARLESGIAYAQQSTPIFDGTVAQNVDLEFEAKLLKMGKPGAALAESALDGLRGVLPQGPGSLIGGKGVVLSGGQLKRIALARALSSNPSILILDEVTSGLDPGSNKEVLDFLASLSGKKTVILVSHNPGDASIANFLLLVHNGEVMKVTDRSLPGMEKKED